MVELTLGGLSCDEDITGDVLAAIETAVTAAVEEGGYIVPSVNVTKPITSDCQAGSVVEYMFDTAILYVDPDDLPMMSRRLQLQGSEIVSLLNTNSGVIIASLSGSELQIFSGDLSVTAFNAVTDAPSTEPSASPSGSPTASPSGSPTTQPSFSPTDAPSASPVVAPVASPVAPPADSAGAISSVKYAFIFALTYFVGAVLEM